MEQIAAIHPLVLSLASMPIILVSFGANNKVRGWLLSVRFSEKGFKFYDDTVRESTMSEKSVRKNRTIHTCFVSQSPKCSRGCPCDRARLSRLLAQTHYGTLWGRRRSHVALGTPLSLSCPSLPFKCRHPEHSPAYPLHAMLPLGTTKARG